jgi:ketol-acid reductoisomerase
MAELFYDNHADLGRLQDRRIAIIGYGSQGHAHALSLKDSGLDVRVGLHPAPEPGEGRGGGAHASADGRGGGRGGDIIMILIPDTMQARSTRSRSSRTWRGEDADVRPRLQHPLRPDRPAGPTWT